MGSMKQPEVSKQQTANDVQQATSVIADDNVTAQLERAVAHPNR